MVLPRSVLTYITQSLAGLLGLSSLKVPLGFFLGLLFGLLGKSESTKSSTGYLNRCFAGLTESLGFDGLLDKLEWSRECE